MRKNLFSVHDTLPSFQTLAVTSGVTDTNTRDFESVTYRE
jgi:hypothetical protein